MDHRLLHQYCGQSPSSLMTILHCSPHCSSVLVNCGALGGVVRLPALGSSVVTLLPPEYYCLTNKLEHLRRIMLPPSLYTDLTLEVKCRPTCDSSLGVVKDISTGPCESSAPLQLGLVLGWLRSLFCRQVNCAS